MLPSVPFPEPLPPYIGVFDIACPVVVVGELGGTKVGEKGAEVKRKLNRNNVCASLARSQPSTTHTRRSTQQKTSTCHRAFHKQPKMDGENDRLAKKIQYLSDIELAVLVCLVADQHCIIKTERNLLDAVARELRLVRTEVQLMLYY
jgi:hypothetical protein